MPSARALLVASLLTEPPYGCLGPPGNDRYRKRSLRSQTVGGFASQLPKSRRLFRNESATSRRVRGRCYWMIHRNDRYCILSQIAPSTEKSVGLEVGPSEPATEEGKIKRTGVREFADRSAVEKPLSAHWFLESPRLALNDVPSRPDGTFRACRGISTAEAMALADFNSKVSAFHLLPCASLRFSTIDTL